MYRPKNHLTEFVGEPTSESPTSQKSRDRRSIRRNARNLIVASVHMTNEVDEIQVNSLSPSNINIQKSRRVNFSVDTGNEGVQSSTSVPSEVEALGNVVDADQISRPHYKTIYMTTVGLRTSKRNKSEKQNAAQQSKILVSQHIAHSLQ